MRSKEAFAYSRITGYFCSVVNVRVSGSSKRPDPPRLGKAGRGLPRRTWGTGRVMTKLTNAAPLARSVRWKGLQQGFIYSWAVSTYRTPRDV
jgi:hypothetical protein